MKANDKAVGYVLVLVWHRRHYLGKLFEAFDLELVQRIPSIEQLL